MSKTNKKSKSIDISLTIVRAISHIQLIPALSDVVERLPDYNDGGLESEALETIPTVIKILCHMVQADLRTLKTQLAEDPALALLEASLTAKTLQDAGPFPWKLKDVPDHEDMAELLDGRGRNVWAETERDIVCLPRGMAELVVTIANRLAEKCLDGGD
jgi:hypothetical protein